MVPSLPLLSCGPSVSVEEALKGGGKDIPIESRTAMAHGISETNSSFRVK